MSPSGPSQRGQDPAKAVGIHADSPPGSAQLIIPFTATLDGNEDMSVHSVIDASSQDQEMTQDSIRTVLYQLKNDLIEAVRMLPTPVEHIDRALRHEANAESSVEIAIERCVNSTLEKYAANSNADLSSQIEASALPLIARSNTDPSPPDESTTGPSEIVSDQPNMLPQVPNWGPEVPISWKTHPLELSPSSVSGSISSTSHEPSNTNPTASPVANDDEKSGRKHARTEKRRWETHRRTLERLYLKEGKPLSDITRIMAEEYGFRPTPKQYRYQFGVKWSWKKYNQNNITRPSSNRTSSQSDPKEFELALNRSSPVLVQNSDYEGNRSNRFFQHPSVLRQMTNENLDLARLTTPIEVTDVISPSTLTSTQPALDWYGSLNEEDTYGSSMNTCNFDIADFTPTIPGNGRPVPEESLIPESSEQLQPSSSMAVPMEPR